MFSLDDTRWIPKSGVYAGFQCTECGIWRGASEFLNCKCDMETQFVIAGKEFGEPVWWHNEIGWIDEITDATTYTKGIVGHPLPPGAEGLLELTLTGEHVAFYSTLPHGGS